MKNRTLLALGAACVAVTAACGAPPAALGSRTAQLTVNGDKLAEPVPVECSQVGWTWLISSFGKDAPGFTASVSTGETMEAHSVQLNDVDGFTGAYWEGTVGDGRASINNGAITISGTAEGSFADNPDSGSEATYEITTKC
ncbi:hypothetical protein E4P42_25135 [Mycobacterium sp. PS03-16]|uniref:lipoprotein LpqH n=1 Tax=Mycobacterium sp. PS03-16 TaxID=2559611 RepID=UPI0010748A58|nr:lipoprotein LpqH [Mycobacterium sp. PS03-16]TFV54698.1 hypothetical protein E4P42_25135 [Mycobacterium sp. PS03-16]